MGDYLRTFLTDQEKGNLNCACRETNRPDHPSAFRISLQGPDAATFAFSYLCEHVMVRKDRLRWECTENCGDNIPDCNKLFWDPDERVYLHSYDFNHPDRISFKKLSSPTEPMTWESGHGVIVTLIPTDITGKQLHEPKVNFCSPCDPVSPVETRLAEKLCGKKPHSE